MTLFVFTTVLKGCATVVAIGMGIICVTEVEADGFNTQRAAWLYGTGVAVMLWGIWL